MKYFLFANLSSFLIGSNVHGQIKQVDVCVYDVTSVGVIAADSVKRQQLKDKK